MADVLGQVIADAARRVWIDLDRREIHQVTQLHHWRRARNGRWVNEGHRQPPGWYLRWDTADL